MDLIDDPIPVHPTANQLLAQPDFSITDVNMATNGNINHSDQFQTASNAPSTTSTTAPATDSTSASSNNNLSKDEVAWFFVEQYYTTLSKSPEKLHVRTFSYSRLHVPSLLGETTPANLTCLSHSSFMESAPSLSMAVKQRLPTFPSADR